MITDHMVANFNEILINNDCPLRIYKDPHNDYGYEIKVVQHRLVQNSSLVYPTKEFYDMLNRHFGIYGVHLSFNNTGTTFWSH